PSRLFLGKASVLPFTDEELAFLRRHRISLDDVHDGRYQSKPVWQDEARENGKTLVLGSPCRARGHRLRTRTGHCTVRSQENHLSKTTARTVLCLYCRLTRRWSHQGGRCRRYNART